MSTAPERFFNRVKPYWRTFRFADHFAQDESDAEPASLADRIERIGHAITAQELASLLNVSPITIFKRAKAGLIPSFRVGAMFRQ
ncbi:MAG: hypothetical protein DMG88_12265 [Acidobacteria bacterium]|nr:MAG: hypothetical protein DMG88_12265 [Acidobacteriota bacterium]